MSHNTTLRFRFSAPRWAKITEFYKREALFFDLEVKIEKSKGLLTETGTVVFSGDFEAVEDLTEVINTAINNYNK